MASTFPSAKRSAAATAIQAPVVTGLLLIVAFTSPVRSDESQVYVPLETSCDPDEVTNAACVAARDVVLEEVASQTTLATGRFTTQYPAVGNPKVKGWGTCATGSYCKPCVEWAKYWVEKYCGGRTDGYVRVKADYPDHQDCEISFTYVT